MLILRAILTVVIALDPFASGAQSRDGVDAAILLGVDVSGSIDAAEIGIQRDGYARALLSPDLISAITSGSRGRVALGYFEWSSHVNPESVLRWRVIETPDHARAFAAEIEALPRRSGLGTSISRAIDFGASLLSTSGFAPDTPLILDISGDGPNNSGPPVTEARDRAVAAGVTVNGLPILSARPPIFVRIEAYYRGCVIGGPGSFALLARDARDLETAILRKLAREIAVARRSAARLVPARWEQPIRCAPGVAYGGR